MIGSTPISGTSKNKRIYAGMAELADALDLGSSVPDVRVQVSLSAPRSKKVNLAGIAQLVEHNLAKVRVASSSLVSSSKVTYYIWGYSSVWESDALALRRSAVRSRLSPPLCLGSSVG